MENFFHYQMPDIIFTLYLLVYFPFDSIRRSLSVRPPKPKLPALQGYWHQGRFALTLLAVCMLVNWLENHSARQLGLGPPSPAGFWGLAISTALVAVLHIFGKRAESKMTPEQRGKQEEKLRELPLSMPQTRVEIVAYFVIMIGMTAIWELLFRGYLLLILTPFTGLPLAVALAAISYGAGHGFKSIKQFAASIVAAFFFTIGYALTGSLWWLMVLHAAAPVAMFFTVRKLSQDKPMEVAIV